jgi:hypothetical protein
VRDSPPGVARTHDDRGTAVSAGGGAMSYGHWGTLIALLAFAAIEIRSRGAARNGGAAHLSSLTAP